MAVFEARDRGADHIAKARSVLLLVVAGISFGCNGSPAPSSEDPVSSGGVAIPEPSEWEDAGEAVAAGPAGSWDARLSGALSPATMIKIEGTYLLYYVGADGDRQAPPGDDGGPRHRALGVATSQDGIQFTKYGGNPVIQFRPTPDGTNAQEEGVFSATAATFDAEVNLYFGGMTMTGDTGVRIDIYHTTSSEGLAFEPPEKVLDARDPDIWGNDGTGDEIFPAGILAHGENRHLYYLTKNRATGAEGTSGNQWDYGVVTGSDPESLEASRKVLLQSESSLGGEFRNLSVNRIGPDRYALFMVNYDATGSKTNVEVRTVAAAQPGSVSRPEITLTFPRKEYAIVFLDEASGRWLMYHRSDEDPEAPIRIRTAPLRRPQ